MVTKKLIMKLIIKLLGILILLIGVSLLIKPEIIFGWIEANLENRSLYIFAIVFRLAFGILLIIAAKKSNYPVVIKVIGFIAVIAAIVLIAIGQKSFQEFATSVIPDIRPYTAVVGLAAMVIGGFIVYAFSNYKTVKS